MSASELCRTSILAAESLQEPRPKNPGEKDDNLGIQNRRLSSSCRVVLSKGDMPGQMTYVTSRAGRQVEFMSSTVHRI